MSQSSSTVTIPLNFVLREYAEHRVHSIGIRERETRTNED